MAWTTFALHCLSLAVLAKSLQPSRPEWSALPLTVVILAWATWATTALASLLKETEARLERANDALSRHGEELEDRVAERSAALRASQARVIHQEKMAAFGLLAAGIAHEVGNPLAAISSLVQLLQRKSPDPDTLERYQMMDDQLRRIQSTLRELIDFSRPASKQEVLCNIHEVVENALSIAKYYKRRKGKRIITRYAVGLPPIRIARDQYVQVCLNLIQNAMDATQEGGLIEITTRLTSGWICIAFRDDGHGIPDESRSRLFDPYFTTKETGTGLGLFVCRQILEQSGHGKMELTATSSRGTTFSVLVTSEAVQQHPDVPVPDE